MDCPWRRTLASVFLLLSPHSVRVLSQNVMPTGPLPPLPFMREPVNDIVGFGQGNFQQQMNLMQPLPGSLPELTPLVPCAPSFQGPGQFRFPPPSNKIGPSNLINPTALNIEPILPVSTCNIEPLVNGLPFQDPVCYAAPNVNIPAQGSIPPLPFSFPPPVISLPFATMPQIQGCNTPSITNLPPPDIKPFSIPQIPLIPGPPNQIYSGPQKPLGLINQGQSFVPTSSVELQNSQLFSPAYPQQYPAAVLNSQLPCSGPADLPIVPFLPSPSLPPTMPVQNCAPPILPPSYQAILPPQLVPVEYIPIAPEAPVNVPAPNFPIAALPPVLPKDLPQYYDYKTCSRPLEDYNPVPINLEINVPSPTMPEPKITVITAFTSPPSSPTQVVATDSSDVSLGLFPPPPLPPIIIEGRRSRSRSWLPLILIALFARDGYDGGCCCPCPCNACNADIPIPFPIAIPTNNPIILGGRSSRSRRPRVKVEKKD